MKKQILSLALLFLSGYSFSQVIFSENFDGATTMPAGWVLHNVDGLTPATNVNYVNDAWVVVANSVTSQGNHIVATSWYTPAGTSNDWAVSPSIAIPASGSFELKFDAMAPDVDYSDGFKVYISTTGTAVSDFGATPALTVNAAANTYTSYSVSLASYAGQTIHFAIRSSNTDKFLVFADNFMVRQPLQNDAVLVSSTLNRYSLANTNNTLSVKVKNNGSNPITSLDLSWNDGTAHTITLNSNIAIGATVTLNHTTPVNYATINTFDIAVDITAVNGGVDPIPVDNTGSTLITTLSQIPAKKVVIEEGTGTWCGWCPRGAVAMDYMTNNYPDFIGVAVHNGDPMTVTAYDAGASFGGFPSANVDRVILDANVGQSDFVNYYNQRINKISPAATSITATSNGNNVTINTSATFYSNFPTANFRLGVIIAEDGVTGTGSGYNQANYYAGGGSGVMGGFEALTDPVPAASMVYNHVGRALLGGYNGQTGSVPAAITDGQTANYTFNYTVPATSNINNMYAVVVVIDNTTGEIVNANKTVIANAGVDNVQTIELAVYPNPASDKLNVSFEAQGGDYLIEVTDLQGRVVLSESHSKLSGSQNIEVNTSKLGSGNYLLSVAQSGASFTKMISIK